MFTLSFADLWRLPAPARVETHTGREISPYSGPVLMGDILVQRQGRPEFLHQWDRAQAVKSGQDLE